MIKLSRLLETISIRTSKMLQRKLGYESFDSAEFHAGMNVELEHSDVTKGDLVATAKIAASHLKEKPNYYSLLKRVES